MSFSRFYSNNEQPDELSYQNSEFVDSYQWSLFEELSYDPELAPIWWHIENKVSKQLSSKLFNHLVNGGRVFVMISQLWSGGEILADSYNDVDIKFFIDDISELIWIENFDKVSFEIVDFWNDHQRDILDNISDKQLTNFNPINIYISATF